MFHICVPFQPFDSFTLSSSRSDLFLSCDQWLIQYEDDPLKVCWHIYRSPYQLLQLALNEPDESIIHQSAKEVIPTLNISYFDWITKPKSANQLLATIDMPAVIGSISVSKDGKLLAMGGEDCKVHVYQTNTCQVKPPFISYYILLFDPLFKCHMYVFVGTVIGGVHSLRARPHYKSCDLCGLVQTCLYITW